MLRLKNEYGHKFALRILFLFIFVFALGISFISGAFFIFLYSFNKIDKVQLTNKQGISYEKGKVISGLDQVDEDVVVFHAGTAEKDGAIVTSGGRVLGVTATGATHDEARAKAFANVERISFEGAQYRRDIGKINRTV